MNLYIRLFLTLIFSRFKRKISLFEDVTTVHRVWPNDLDLLGHVNNGRYFTITDFVRIGALVRAGVWKNLRKDKLIPVMAGETAQFRKPLRPFQRYEIITRCVGWDERFMYVDHKFVSKAGIHAVLLVKVAFLSRKGQKPRPSEIIEKVESGSIPPVKMTEFIEQWGQSSKNHWELRK